MPILRDQNPASAFARSHSRTPSSRPRPRAVHGAWFLGGCAYAFLIPYLFSDRLNLPHDGYYLTYFTAVSVLMVAYVRSTRADWRNAFRRAWGVSLALGLASTAFVVMNVLRDPATPGPHGLGLVREVIWRGALYGAIDRLLLTAFPVLVATAFFHGRLTGLPRRLGFALATLALSLVITASYHAGYSQFREHGWARNGLGGPLIGNAVISLPAAISTNPIGSVVTHMAMHVTAVTHAYETDVFLPPRRRAPEP
jgi:hypothetical protein